MSIQFQFQKHYCCFLILFHLSSNLHLKFATFVNTHGIAAPPNLLTGVQHHLYVSTLKTEHEIQQEIQLQVTWFIIQRHSTELDGSPCPPK